MVKCHPQYPPHCKCHLLVGCCLNKKNGGHLMPEPCPSLNFLIGCLFDAPNKRTSPSESAPDALRLAWSHWEQQHQDLGQWQMLPWREGEEEPLGLGWCSGSSCFFVLCVCFVVFMYFCLLNSCVTLYIIP